MLKGIVLAIADLAYSPLVGGEPSTCEGTSDLGKGIALVTKFHSAKVIAVHYHFCHFSLIVSVQNGSHESLS